MQIQAALDAVEIGGGGSDGTQTPTNLKNGTFIVFDDVGDSAHLKFMDGGWV